MLLFDSHMLGSIVHERRVKVRTEVESTELRVSSIESKG